MIRALIYISTAIGLAILVHSCAIVRPATGGEKDTEGPVIKKSTPLSGSTNYKENFIRLDFDEFVVLNNLGSEMVVSPPLNSKPKSIVKGKSLIIEFDEELLPNTTYTFNLGNGVKDFHEGNILDSNVVVFSTGPEIDSGFVQGKVNDAFSLQPSGSYWVMLYSQLKDSIPAQKKPTYFGKTKEDGSFEINYLKTGEYQLFVLNDKNSNYLYDQPDEEFGFAEQTISINGATGVSEANIHTFKQFVPNQFFVESKQDQYGRFMLSFNQPLTELKLKPLGVEIGNDWATFEYDDNKDTVWVWTKLKSLNDAENSFEISDNGEILDTVDIKLMALPENQDEIKKLAPNLSINQKKGIVKYFEQIEIKSTSPISLNTTRAYLTQNSEVIEVTLNQKNDFTLTVEHDLKQESSFELILVDSTVTNLLGFSHDTLKFGFKTLSDVEYANLTVNFNNQSQGSRLIQLWTEDHKSLIKEITITSESELSFNNLGAGKYRLKMIFDDNQNKKWDSGTFIPRKQAERVIYLPEIIEIKEGWDKKIEWTIPE